jgi:hypothetical protein
VRDPAGVLARIVEIFASGETAGAADVIAADYVDHQGVDGVEFRGAQLVRDS